MKKLQLKTTTTTVASVVNRAQSHLCTLYLCLRTFIVCFFLCVVQGALWLAYVTYTMALSISRSRTHIVAIGIINHNLLIVIYALREVKIVRAYRSVMAATVGHHCYIHRNETQLFYIYLYIRSCDGEK